MNLNSIKKIYNKSPIFVKRLTALFPNSMLYGKEYKNFKNVEIENIDLEEYQFKKLKETIELANNNIPFYQKSFKSIGFHPNDLKNITQVKHLPFIDKDVVRENFNDLINQHCKKSFFVATGGSSGDSMRFLQSNNVWAKENAFVHSFFERYGYDYSLKVTFRGGDFQSGSIFKFNPINNEIQFSPFLLSKNTIFEYAKILNKYRPKFLHAYPSAVRAFMENLIESNVELNFEFKAIFLISENVAKKDIKDFNDYFNAVITAFYGHSERLVFAPLISNEIEYRENKKYGFSFVENSELIATSFDNFAMPLINYKTNDYVDSWRNGVFKIKGRWDGAFVIGKNDEKISITALNVHTSIFDDILSYQYIQERKGEVKIICVPKKGIRESQLLKIKSEFDAKTKGAVSFLVEISEQAILTERGKFKKIISKL